MQAASKNQPIRVHGSRGPLSQREADRLLKRLALTAPNEDEFDRHLAVEQALSGSSLYTGNRIAILRDGQQSFGAIFNVLHHAQHYLYLEYFILQDVTFDHEALKDLLIERHRHGVQIDIIYDTVGSLQTPSAFFQQLQQAGIRVRHFNPITPFSAHFSINQRDHRKILVADGQTAIIGGINLSTNYEHTLSGGSGDGDESRAAPAHSSQDAPGRPPDPATAVWHDTDLQIDGPAVTELKELFEQHWRQQGGSADDLISEPGTPESHGNQVVRIIGSRGGQLLPRYYATLLSAIRTATERVWITSAYFVPTLQERQALVRAARRGVDVRLLLPSNTDSKAALAVQHSNYGPLLSAGVKIYERQDGIVHSKTAVMDGVWSVVGSSNFDHRSVLFNDEVDAVVLGATTGTALEQDFLQDLEHARQIDLATWHKRPFSSKVRERFWRLWQQML